MSVVILNDTQYSYTIFITSTAIGIQKISQSGDAVWRYDQPNTDTKSDLSAVIDASMDILITYTITNEESSQIVLMKVSNTDPPVLAWSLTGFTSAYRDSRPRIATDGESSCFLAFQTNGILSGKSKTGITDIAIIKFDSTGSIIWSLQNGSLNVSSRLNLAPSIAVAPSGVITVGYVTTGNIEIVQEITAEGHVIVPPPSVPCFLANSPVKTRKGYVPIQYLKKGDEVETTGGLYMKVSRVIKRCVKPSIFTNPYVIPKGQFGATQRVYLSPNHRVRYPGGEMVCAKDLGFRQWIMKEPFDYYNVELEEWEPMFVAGVEVESMAPRKLFRASLDIFKKYLSTCSNFHRQELARSSCIIGNQVYLSLIKRKGI